MAAGRKNAVKKPPESASHGRRHGRHGFDPWVEKIPWGRAWQPTPVFSPGKSHGQRSLEGYSPWGCRVTAEAEGPCWRLRKPGSLASCMEDSWTPGPLAPFPRQLPLYLQAVPQLCSLPQGRRCLAENSDETCKDIQVLEAQSFRET